MKTKIIIVIALSLLAASCSLFAPATGGIFKTANGGIDWQVSNKLKNSESTLSNLSVSKMAFSPHGADIVYAGAYNGGIYKSSDGGGSWEEALGQIPIFDFVIHPDDDQTIYAAGAFDDHGRVLVTHDGGKSWTEIFSAAETSTVVRTVALNPANPQEVLIGTSAGAVIISHDGGTNWQLVQNYNDRINRIIWRYEGVYVVVRGTGVFASRDGGNSFQQITANLNSSGNTRGVNIFGSSIGTYNQLAVSESNPNLIYLSTNQGLYRSENGGGSWQFVNLPLRQNDLAPHAIAIAPGSDQVIYVSAKSNIYKSSDGGLSWVSSDTGTNNLVNALLISPDLPQVAFAGIYLNINQ